MLAAFHAILATYANEGLTNPIGEFNDLYGGVEFKRVDHGNSRAYKDRWVKIADSAFEVNGVLRSQIDIIGTIVHELGHIWDYSTGGELSDGLMDAVGGTYEYEILGIPFNLDIQIFDWGQYNISDTSPYPSITYAGQKDPPNPKEDWAETFEAFVVSYSDLYNLNRTTTRPDYVSQKIGALGK